MLFSRNRIIPVLRDTLLLFLIFSFLHGVVPLDYVHAQSQQEFSIYENPDFGLRFQYPSHWIIYNYPPDLYQGGNIIGSITNFKEDPTISSTSYPRFALYVVPLSDIGVQTNASLIDYLKYYYKSEYYGLIVPPDIKGYLGQYKIDYTLINDNQTTIGNGYDAWQIESTSKTIDHTGRATGHMVRELDIYTINEGVLYNFEYAADPGPKFSENLPAIRKVLDSIEFIPIPQLKQPSFLQ